MFKNLDPSCLGISASHTELVEWALSSGIRGLSIDILDVVEKAKSGGVKLAIRALESAKIRIGEFFLPFDLYAEEGEFRKSIQEISQWGEVAKQVGALRCMVEIHPASDSLPMHQNFEFHRQRLSEICKALEPHGIQLGLSIRPAVAERRDVAFEFIHTYEALFLLLGMLGSKQAGIVIDSWNLRVGRSTWASLVPKIKVEQVVAVRLADLAKGIDPLKAEPKDRVLPHEGSDLEHVAILVSLAERGYQGPVTCAPDPSAHASVRRDALIKQTSAALDQVWKAAGLSAAGKLAAPASR